MFPVSTRSQFHSPVLALRMVCGLTAGLLSGSALASGLEGAAAATVRKTGAKNPAVVWESLPAIRTGVKIRSHTSKSALNCTIMDWTNYTLQDGNGYEQAFVKGCSGMLIHSWFAWQNAPAVGHGGLRGEFQRTHNRRWPLDRQGIGFHGQNPSGQ